MTQLLDNDFFRTVVSHTPLVSIDLIVRNTQDQVLLGLRANRPAQGHWFVPGGRILKEETLANAFKRLTQDELGQEMLICNAHYLGLYEHFYDDSSFGSHVSTHYVVNGFEIQLSNDDLNFPQEQHYGFCWFSVPELMASDKVHIHTKWYFDKDKGFL